jgi:fatty acid CoA ligase FadD9
VTAPPVVSWTAPARSQGEVWRGTLVRALEGEEVVAPLRNAAFHKYTRQSTRVEEVPPLHELLFMRATAREAAPWWEVDLGGAMWVEAIHVELYDAPAGSRVTIAAFPFATPAGDPPAVATIHEEWLERGGAHRISVPAPAVRIARHVRVTLHAPEGETVELAVRDCEIVAADLFAATLRGTMRRAFALHRERTLFVDLAPGAAGAAMTYEAVWSQAMALARALAARLEPAEDRRFVVVATRNRPEWVIADQAILARGYVSVAMAPDDGDERAARILELTRPACIVCEAGDAERLARLCPTPALLVVCDAAAPLDGEGRVRFEDLVATGAALAASDVPAAAERREEELYAVLFTSGSTGQPRGAMRTYATFHAMLGTYGAGQPLRHLSFQPLSHLSERMFLPALLVNGATIAFSRGGAHLMDELRAFAPTLVGSVPRLFDVLYAGYQRRLRAAIAAEPDTPRAVHEARALAEARGAFGKNVQSVSVGSAPVSPEVLAFMRRCFADLWVTEGYGSTEVGTIAVDGRIQSHVEVKLVPRAEDVAAAGAPERGEIWVRTPHMIAGYLGDAAATNAAIDGDGYFATGDLGERGGDGSVRVIGRLRNAVKLAQGEFVSAERVEAALATADGVDRIYVHAAAGAPGIAALVAPARDATGAADATAASMLAVLRAHGRRAGLSAWELPRGVVLADAPFTVDNGLLTASGKLARGAIARLYDARLTALASGGPPDAPAASDHDPGTDLAARIARVVAGAIGRAIAIDEPLAGAGVDSLAAAEILAALSDDLGRDVPLTLWFEAATIDDLAIRLETFADPGTAPALRDLALADLAAGPNLSNLTNFPPSPSQIRDGDGGKFVKFDNVALRRVLVTGATGFLGAHIVEELVARTDLEIVCLVRAADDAAAKVRLGDAFARHRVPLGAIAGGRVRAIAGDLAAPGLGRDDEANARLADEVDAIVHVGAVVSWLAPYAAVRAANIGGTRALLEIAASGGRVRPFHHVSTISTAPATGDERTILDERTAFASSPYALSKWIAEHHVRRAGEAGLPVAIYRPALIAGHSARGHGNRDDFLHRYLAGVTELGLYLDLDDAVLDMTPVDFVARAITALVTAAPQGDGATYHLANVDQSMTYARLGRALVATGIAAQPSPYDRFRAALLAAPSSRLAALAAFFPAAGFALGSGPWPCAATVAALTRLGVARPPVDDALVARFVRATVEIGPE